MKQKSGEFNCLVLAPHESNSSRLFICSEQAELPQSKHSSEIKGLRSMKCSSEMLQNLPHFWITKSHVVFFISCYFIFSSNKCLGLC